MFGGHALGHLSTAIHMRIENRLARYELGPRIPPGQPLGPRRDETPSIEIKK